ncbi:MAG: Holliday junction resolvase RuvX [Pirellulales bacterium]|nr:Holliday junction resolvase RuvX [Pirellulales bacterium]
MTPVIPPPQPSPPLGRVAGIDYGTVRIGVAISDPGRTIASPYENYTRRGPDQDARRFRRLIEEEQIRLFVVGLPVHLDGRESEKSHEARTFGQWLAKATGVPVEFFDERFTSTEAEQFLLDAQLTKKRRKQRLDMLAAQIMLSAYLESTGKGRLPPEPLED